MRHTSWSIAVLALTVIAAAGTSPGLAQSPAPPSPCSSPDARIEEAAFVPIGGIEQWVTITGRRCGNPIVLFLHGGPGNPLSPYADTLFAGWEEAFTLVQWDQRGAGRTFGRHPPPEDDPLTVDRMVRDGLEVAAYAAQRLGQSKVVLVGGSWGSILGVHMIKVRPSLFHAYVGFAQIVEVAQNQSATYTRLLALARAADDRATLDALEAVGPPPWTNPRHPGIVRRLTRTYEGRVADEAPMQWRTRASESDAPALRAEEEQGEEYSYLQFVGLKGDGMFAGVDLPAIGTRFDVPVFLVQGAEDLVTTPEVTRAYFERIVAPEKEMVLVPHTGHDPNERLLAAIRGVLDQRVRPLTAP